MGARDGRRRAGSASARSDQATGRGAPSLDAAAPTVSATGGLGGAPLDATTTGLSARVARCVAPEAATSLRLVVHASGEVLDIDSGDALDIDAQICLQDHRWRLRFPAAEGQSLVDFTSNPAP